MRISDWSSDVCSSDLLRGALAGVQSVLDIAPARLHYELRQSQKGTSQYQRQGDNEHMVVIDEHGCKLHVNFDDYLDTGVFLDHRTIRKPNRTQAARNRFPPLSPSPATHTAHKPQ